MRTLFLSVAIGFAASVYCSAQSNSAALTNWLSAQSTFQSVGTLVGQKKYAPAQKLLQASTGKLPMPYSDMATQFVQRIDGLIKETDAAVRVEAASELCAELQSYPAALKLKPARKASKDDDDENDNGGWFLFEVGDLKGALAQYRQRIPREDIEVYRDYYKKQLELLPARAANLNSAPLALDTVSERYLKGYERKPDYFGALRELNRALPLAKGTTNAVKVHQEIVRCLSSLNDEAGVEAWENKILADFSTDVNACAGVYADRGLRAYHARRDYETALRWMRQACAVSANSMLWGDAQYSVGLILQDQKKYDEAIAAFNVIFPSKVNDHLLEEGNTEDCKNYRFKSALRVSECYESKGDLPHALEFAELAKTKYQFVSFCAFCQKRAREELDKRIGALQQKIKAQ